MLRPNWSLVVMGGVWVWVFSAASGCKKASRMVVVQFECGSALNAETWMFFIAI
jgi:hypothetical protein